VASDAARIARKVFLEVHTDLPREAPGSAACTARALAAATLPGTPLVLDIGCGPGTQTIDLATRLPGATITAIDAHEPFVSTARDRIRSAGLADRVSVAVGDMRELTCPEAHFDLLWCEGAVYIMGVHEALEAWRHLFKPGGHIGCTEAVWLNGEPPGVLSAWWKAAYPKMGRRDDCLSDVRESGFEVVDSFVLPEAAWWDDYYGPMERRLDTLRDRYRADPPALAAIDEHQREIDYYRRWSDHYGYLFVVARRPGAG